MRDTSETNFYHICWHWCAVERCRFQLPNPENDKKGHSHTVVTMHSKQNHVSNNYNSKMHQFVMSKECALKSDHSHATMSINRKSTNCSMVQASFSIFIIAHKISKFSKNIGRMAMWINVLSVFVVWIQYQNMPLKPHY